MASALETSELKIVYHDEYYGRAWITKEWTANIVNYLKRQGFYEKNAKEVRDWVKQRIIENDAHRSVIVFSQDIVPKTIMTIKSPSDLIRRYLDASGRIVWIGDHPFWYRGILHEDGGREEIWQTDIHYGMLGVQMLMAECSSVSEWMLGWREKMKSRWYSQRPVNINIAEDPYDLRILKNKLGLRNETLAYAYVVLSPSSWNAFVITRWKKAGTKIGAIGLGVSTFGGNITLTEKFPKELSLEPQKLACSWHVTFNEKHPDQGFYRFWDCDSTEDDPPADLLQDIFTLATLNLM